MWDQFFIAVTICFGVMFPIINPVGHAPMFYLMTQQDSLSYRHRQAFKTSVYTFFILVISLIGGSYILRFFGLNLADVRVAGGILIARAAWTMLGNVSRITQAEKNAAKDKEDISLTPMATPILSGPGAMSLAIGLLTFGHAPAQYIGYITGFLLIAITTWICLHYAEHIVYVLGINGTGALNRILGFLILAIGVHLVMEGIQDAFFDQLDNPVIHTLIVPPHH